ncbi:MAG: hypothetical protein E3J47_05910 [Candidatus Stahlbacteria bacterium]|nr:MAG: hypothetical protein E3J47_05910 [Candidatus Stahlbacteria bacterium]
MKKVIDKFCKWFSDNGKYILGLLVIMVIVTALICGAMSKEKTKADLRNNIKQISNVVKEQTESIKLLTEERSQLQKMVRRLRAKKMQEKDNIKNYILTYYKTVAPLIAEEMAIRIIEKSTIHNVPFVAVIAVTEVESHFNPFAISPKGARGAMQVMPRIWVKELGLSSKYDLHDIEIGIDSGVRILRRYLDATDNDMRKALFKYVGGSHPYIKQVYESMGKFIVFKSFSDIKVSEEEEEDKKDIADTKIKVGNETKVDNETIEAKIPAKVKSNILFTHIVKKGETLGLLANWYTGNVNNWRKISEANPNIIPKQMQIGVPVIIPTNLLKNTTPLR